MAKTIEWVNPDEKGVPTEDRQIKESEDVTQTLKRDYTLKQKQEVIDMVKDKIKKLQERVPKLEAELKAIKTALKVT